jgi:uncharacterized protein YdaU (DUF1376 family)
MTQQPWFPFYPSDFLASPKVRRMTLEERGAYITLLCDQWNDGPIPVESLRERLENEHDLREGWTLERIWRSPLKDCFTERDGVVFNPRLERERAHMEGRSQAASSRAAGAQWSDADAMRMHADACQTETQKGGEREKVAGSRNKRGSDRPSERLVARINDIQGGMYLCDGVEIRASTGGQRRRITEGELRAVLAQRRLTEEAEEALVAWRRYREDAKIKPLTPKGWEILFADAAKDPRAFCAKVEHSIASGYQGLFSPGKPPTGEPAPNDPRLKPYDPDAPEDPEVVAARERARAEREAAKNPPRSCPPLSPQGGEAGRSSEGGAPTPGSGPTEVLGPTGPDERPKKSLGRLF